MPATFFNIGVNMPPRASLVREEVKGGYAEGGALRHPIVLIHNQPAGNPATVSALPAIIQSLRSHGYRFVAL